MNKAEKAGIRMALKRFADKSLRRIALGWLRKRIPNRRTSDSFAKDHPEYTITPAQLKLCYKLSQEGCTLRQIEAIMHLVPNGGNNAHRCIKMYEDQVKATQGPVDSDFVKKVLETLTLPPADRKQHLQEMIRLLDQKGQA